MKKIKVEDYRFKWYDKLFLWLIALVVGIVLAFLYTGILLIISYIEYPDLTNHF